MTAPAIVLAILVAGTLVVGIHAGGHAWLLPIPALLVGVAWALTAASGSPSGVAAWSLAAVAILVSAAGLLLAGIAAAQRRHDAFAMPSRLRAADGVALTALNPGGVVRVDGETWSADSLSGPLPTGSTVHVSSIRGLRLQVWSETGTVPGAAALEPAAPTEQKEST
jgi:membrane-bound ClpP family serine protease